MIPSVAVEMNWHLAHIVAKLGITNIEHFWFDNGRLYVQGVTQKQLDAAINTYNHDLATVEVENDSKIKARQEAARLFDGPQGLLLRAILQLVVKEINILRQSAGLTPRTIGQIRQALQNELDGA